MKDHKSNLPMLCVLFAAAFVAAFNENIINVGMGEIMAAFSVDANTVNWLVTGYMIVTAIVVTVIAFLLRRFKLRTVFFGGSALFVTGSALALLAPTFPLLLACRLLQAAGTGVFIPTMMNTVLAVAPRKKLGTFLSIGGCCITFGPALSPVVSGFMISLLGWRGIFVVPTVAMILIAIAGALLIRNIGESSPAPLDALSVILSAVGLTALVFGLNLITADAVVALVALAAGLLALGVFVVRQGKIANPLLNMAPLHNPRFACACALVVVAMMTTFSMSVLLPLYYTGAMGVSAFAAGALILVPILVNAATALVGGRVFDQRGEWPLLPLGFLLVALGQVAVFLLANSFDLVLMVAASCIVYAGVGLVFSPSQSTGLKTLPPEQNPFGVGIMSTFIQISAAVGPSLFVGVLSSTMANQLSGSASQEAAMAAGFASAVLVAAAIAFIGALVAFVYSRKAMAVDVQAGEKRAAVQHSPASYEASEVQATGATSAANASAAGLDGDISADLTLEGVMKTDVFSVPADAPVFTAVETMLAHHTSGLPVCDEAGMLVGFVSDGDIMKSIADVHGPTSDLYLSLSQLANRASLDQRLGELMRMPVVDLATANVISAHADEPLEKVCTVLSEHHLKKMPVLSDGRLVGTVSRTDVNRALLNRFVQMGASA